MLHQNAEYTKLRFKIPPPLYVGYYKLYSKENKILDVKISMENQMVFHTSSPSLVAVL